VPSEKTKSEIFVEFVALLNSGRVRIPGNKRLRTQFEALERRASRTGKETVDHGPGAHDDLANAVAGALTLAMSEFAGEQPWSMTVIGPPVAPLAEQGQPSFAPLAGSAGLSRPVPIEPMADGDEGPERWWSTF
jgi:hypothetical protein